MKRLLLVLCASFLFSPFVYSQSDLPTISESYYKATYRQNTGFSRTKPTKRVARKLQAPVVIGENMTVYPEDLGYFTTHPDALIEQLNAQKKYGRSNWRIPTPTEISLMESNAAKIGLGEGVYMATTYANGNLRLVSTDGKEGTKTIAPVDKTVVLIGNTYWSKTNVGTTRIGEKGLAMTYQDAVDRAPKGYRLPTEEEVWTLIYSGEAKFGDVTTGTKLKFPYLKRNEGYHCYNETGEYWVQGGNVIWFRNHVTDGWWDAGESYVSNPEIRKPSSSMCLVRYVKDEK